MDEHDITNVIDAIDSAVSEMGYATDAIPMLETGIRFAALYNRTDAVATFAKRIGFWERSNPCTTHVPNCRGRKSHEGATK